MIKVAIVSNYLNIHMKPMCDAFSTKENVVFTFVSCGEASSTRIQIGQVAEAPYEIKAFESKENRKRAKKVLNEADIIIFGSADESIIPLPNRRHKQFLFRYSEKIFRGQRLLWLRRIKTFLLMYPRSRGQSFLLCNGLFVRDDFKSCHLYNNRYLYFGYFPYGNSKKAFDKKTISHSGPIKVLWSGRFLPCKHPEFIDIAAKTLYENNIAFSLTVVGDGPLFEEIRSSILSKKYAAFVHFLGLVDNSSNLRLMAENDFYLFTSDIGDGWGAVVNEAMSSQCCVISSDVSGAPSFLLKNLQNGFKYHTPAEFRKCLLQAATNKNQSQILAQNARKTIISIWNSETAVNNLIDFYDVCSRHEAIPKRLINNGPGTLIDA